jgi:plastocyanin
MLQAGVGARVKEETVRRASSLVALSVVALLMLVPAAGAQNAWSVSIGDNFFAPADAAVGAGDTITWTNEGAEPHTVTAFDGSFDSGILMPGESFS